jgi:serine/threonine protein kinase
VTYAPPEAIETINEERDVWALGCILHEMAAGVPPFLMKSWKELAIILTPNYLKSFPYSSTLPPVLLHLLKHIFVHDHTKRLKIEEVLAHPFFTNETIDPLSLRTEKSEELR